MQTKQGFTLIELLVVISIIGILSALAVVSFSGAQARARDGQRKNDLNALKSALQLYYSDNNKFPTGTCISRPTNSAWQCWNMASASFLLGPNGSTYIKSMPLDPKNYDNGGACTPGNTGSYLYAYYSANGSNYILVTQLENKSDPAINYTGDGGGCTTFGNYKIDSP
ncbi:MAG: type II secretion system protein [Candidatus Curtissbacteria bacterium]